MNTEKRDSSAATQMLILRDRNLLEVRGVTDVVRFDEENVVLSTSCGTLTVEGASLHVQVLNLEQGTVTVDGRVDALLYDDPEPVGKGERGGFFGKLFH